jgi:hypothetical protein
MRLLAFLGSAAVLACLSSPAVAEACGPLKQVASIDMATGPSGRYLVPVTINGAPQTMLLNTAGGITSLRRESADAMGLHAIDASRIKLLSSNGTASQKFAQMDFQLGAIHFPDLQLIVMPKVGDGAPPFVGSLAGDILQRYDVEMDFAGRKLNFFSKDHCPGKVIYWKADAYAVVPVTLQIPTPEDFRKGFRPYSPRGSHINVPVKIDGKDITAVLNTSSIPSTMSTDTAKYTFGVTAESPGAVPVESPDGDPQHRMFRYTFPSLTFDAVTVTNAKFLIYPNLTGSKDPDNDFRTGTRIGRVDDGLGGRTTIGLEILRKLRLYVAYGEDKLYITPATAPQAAAAQ